MCYLVGTYNVPSHLNRFFFLGFLTYLAPRYMYQHICFSLYTPSTNLYCFLWGSLWQIQRKKECRQRGIRVDKWDSSLSCWSGNINVSQRSVRQFKADVITRQREYKRWFILSVPGTSLIRKFNKYKRDKITNVCLSCKLLSLNISRAWLIYVI